MSSMMTLVPVISVNRGPNRLRRWSSEGLSRTWYLIDATPFVVSGIWAGGGTTGVVGATPPTGLAGAAAAVVGATTGAVVGPVGAAAALGAGVARPARAPA